MGGHGHGPGHAIPCTASAGCHNMLGAGTRMHGTKRASCLQQGAWYLQLAAACPPFRTYPQYTRPSPQRLVIPQPHPLRAMDMALKYEDVNTRRSMTAGQGTAFAPRLASGTQLRRGNTGSLNGTQFLEKVCGSWGLFTALHPSSMAERMATGHGCGCGREGNPKACHSRRRTCQRLMTRKTPSLHGRSTLCTSLCTGLLRWTCPSRREVRNGEGQAT